MFAGLGLLRDEGGKTVFDLDAPPLREVMAEIEQGAVYGSKATGKSLVERFARDPFGWDFDVVRLLVAALLRAGVIQMTHKAETIDSMSVAARDGLTNNNHFRAASFQPKKGIEFGDIAEAATHFKDTFGVEAKELAASPLVAELRTQLMSKQDSVEQARSVLQSAGLPGVTVLENALTEIRAILRGTEDAAISAFNAAHQTIKDGIRRAAELESELTHGAVGDLAAAQRVVWARWPVLDAEPDLEGSVRAAAEELRDLLGRETFFRELGDINRCSRVVSEAYDERFGIALSEKVAACQAALAQLLDLPGWPELGPEVREELTMQLRAHAEDTGASEPTLPQLRADRDACVGRLQTLVRRAHEIAEGDRIAPLDVRTFFRGGIEDTEQLEAAIVGLREACERLIADGKKIVVS